MVEEMLDLAGCPVVSNDSEPFVVHVEDEILTLCDREIRMTREMWMGECSHHIP